MCRAAASRTAAPGAGTSTAAAATAQRRGRSYILWIHYAFLAWHKGENELIVSPLFPILATRQVFPFEV